MTLNTINPVVFFLIVLLISLLPLGVAESSETRYFTSDMHGFLNMYMLSVNQTDAPAINEFEWSGNQTILWDTGIYVLDQYYSTKSTIAEGVAQINRSIDGIGVLSNIYAVSQTAFDEHDKLVVIVQMHVGSDVSNSYFVTECLNASELKATTWTVYYYTERYYNASSGKTIGRFFFDNSTYVSRIENIQYDAELGLSFSSGLLIAGVIGALVCIIAIAVGLSKKK